MNPGGNAEEILKKNWGLALVLATLAVYIVLKAILAGPQYGWLDMLFGAAIFLEIISIVLLEVKEGTKKHGWQHEIVDTAIAVAVALAIWFGAQFLLGTSTPVSGVVSCSMLPELQRGDFVIVQGGDVSVPEVELTESEYGNMVNGPFIVSFGETTKSFNAPFHTYCICNPSDEACSAFYDSDAEFVETAGPVSYHYKWCSVGYSGGKMQGKMRCLDYIEIKGKRFEMADKNNNVVVYMPGSTDLYSRVGDIVHRSVARLKVGNETYYMTGGDNNPVLDAQVYDCASGLGNHPVPAANIKGKVIARIPYLGYLKLFISGYWSEDSQCRWVLER